MNNENNNPNKKPAHTLWVELSSRITSQPLHYRSGNEETAVESVHKLFDQIRKLMSENPDATVFHDISLKLINETLRSYTARWHRWMTDAKPIPGNSEKTKQIFKDEQVRRMFRAELKELQLVIKIYISALKQLAENGQIEATTRQELDNSVPKQSDAFLGGDLKAGLPDSEKEINEKEQRYILERRKSLKCQAVDSPLINATAIALSGGGIRSATFCLGIVQALAKNNLFHQFDYLSTVSGGGYLGTFISSALADDPSESTKLPKTIIDEVLTTPAISRESKAVRHLRNCSKYLGTGGMKSMAGQFAYGVFTSLLAMLPIPLLAAAIVYLVDYLGFWMPVAGVPSLWFGLKPSWAGILFNVVMALLLIMVFLLPLVQSKTKSDSNSKLRDNWQKTSIGLAIATIFTGVIYIIPAVIQQYSEFMAHKSAFWQISITGALPIVFGYGAKILNAWKKVQAVVMQLFVLSGPLFFLVVFLIAGRNLGIGADMPASSPFLYLIGTVLLTVWNYLCVNINEISPHRFYRNRLCGCYLIKREKDNIIVPKTAFPLTELCQSKNAAPYHLLNSTVNLTTSKNPELRGRNGDFFVFSKHFCGSRVTGYEPTEDVVARDPHIDLGTAMAISGAAASTGMGWQSMPNFRFLMGLLNIRLGYWLPKAKQDTEKKNVRGPNPTYLFKEILGKMNENDDFLNLSDGGHIENLATYELLKRKCKYIVCVDAGQEPEMGCADLIRLQRYAEIDLGIRMQYDYSDLILDENGLSKAYATLVKIIYPDSTKQTKTELGWMLYVKLAVTGLEPAYVWDYRKNNPTFPHQTTADQFFDEAQFEAYRMLGECAAENMLRTEIVGPKSPETIQEWFQALANNLLPDNDEVFKIN